MMLLEIPPTAMENIRFVCYLITALFAIFLYFKKPQISMEKRQALNEKEIAEKASILSQQEVQSRATLLAQQVQWEKDANEKKFTELSARLSEANTLALNHIHTIDTKVDNVSKLVSDMSSTFGKELVRLSTILEQRLPVK